MTQESAPVLPLSPTGRVLVLATAFLGWFFGGVMLSTTSVAMRPAAIDLLHRVGELDLPRYQALNRSGLAQANEVERAFFEDARKEIESWFAFFTCAMLFGAAAGGFLFGQLGDRWGRCRAMAASILCYAGFAGLASLAQAPWHLLILWFIACLGIGGMWPNGVALVAETWSNLSRPLVAGVMGTSANIGIFLLATLATWVKVTPDSWQWMLHVAASPILLGLFVLLFVPESPRWLASRRESAGAPAVQAPVFRRPYLAITLVGIVLATIPVFGGWGTANWMVPWAGQAGEAADPPDHNLQARVSQARSLTGLVGSLLGGWVAAAIGRRLLYCLSSLAALGCAQYTFWFLVPTDSSFLIWVGALGFFSGLFFGWLPLCLPELFPTQVRSTGAGVCFNFGRIFTALTVFATGALIKSFGGDYSRIGRVTSLLYLAGALVIWLAPNTDRKPLAD